MFEHKALPASPSGSRWPSFRCSFVLNKSDVLKFSEIAEGLGIYEVICE